MRQSTVNPEQKSKVLGEYVAVKVLAFYTGEASGNFLWKGWLAIKSKKDSVQRKLPKYGREAREQWIC